MAVYQLDLYAKTVYGAPLYIAFQAGEMRAEQVEYGALEVSWSTPVQAGNSQILAGLKQWTRLRLVRNAYGVPDAEDDGLILVDQPPGTGGGSGVPVNVFLDELVVPGRVYYYAVFVSAAVDSYLTSAVYQPGDLVFYMGQGWKCLAFDVQGVEPGTDDTVWEFEPQDEEWFRAGGCAGLVVKEFAYGAKLYDLVPRPYKVQEVEITASELPYNEALFKFMNLFGYFFDVMKTENDRRLLMQNVLSCTDKQLSLIAQQMGILNNMPALPVLRRTYVRDAPEIQRDRGSARSLRSLVRATTGWDSEVFIGYNRLLNNDDAAFESPSYPEWNKDIVYFSDYPTGTAYDTIVNYRGNLYASIGYPVRYGPFYPDSPVLTGPGLLRDVADISLDPYPEYTKVANATTSSVLTYRFNTPTNRGEPGTYSLSLVCISDPRGGKIRVKVNGNIVDKNLRPIPTIDTFDLSQQPLAVVRLGDFDLTVNNNTLELQPYDKNPLSKGYDFNAYYWIVQKDAASLNIGVLPDPESPRINWSPIPAGLRRDTVTMLNPLTNGFGNWNIQRPFSDIPNPIINPGFGWHISVKGAAVAKNSPGPGNSLNFESYSSLPTGNVDLFFGGTVYAPTWSPVRNYSPGQAVKWPRGPADSAATSYTYTARTQNTDKQPDVNPEHWTRTSLRLNAPLTETISTPEPELLFSQCVPLQWTPMWTGLTRYKVGDAVTWDGHLYEAARPSFGIFPAGNQRDNLWWRWLGLDSPKYTFSVYHTRNTTGPNQDVRPFIRWYGADGLDLGLAVATTKAPHLLDRFEIENVSYPRNRGWSDTDKAYLPPAGYNPPAPYQQGVVIPWTTLRGDWTTLEQTVRPTSWDSDFPAVRKFGRAVFFDRSWVYTDPDTDGNRAQVTFMSQPEGGPEMEQGIVFRLGQTSFTAGSYWLASRTRLTYNTVTFDGPTGVPTAVVINNIAEWTQPGVPGHYTFKDGERMTVQVSADRIQVWRHRSGPSLSMELLFDRSNETRGGAFTTFGLLERSTAA